MRNWFANLFGNSAPALTVVGHGPVAVSVERLDQTFSLHLTGTANVEGRDDQIASFTIQISDQQALRELHGLLSNALQRLEPPYYSEIDTGSLWEDESPNIYTEINTVIGPEIAKAWIHKPHISFGGQSPHQVIRSGKAYWVRELLRQIKLGTFS
jgi:Protein of unknown function (DUF2384)